jgi:hypothetical protein
MADENNEQQELDLSDVSAARLPAAMPKRLSKNQYFATG